MLICFVPELESCLEKDHPGQYSSVHVFGKFHFTLHLAHDSGSDGRIQRQHHKSRVIGEFLRMCCPQEIPR